MQLFARLESGDLIYALDASRLGTYYCLECQDILKLRGGQQRQLHFYHARRRSRCRHAGKTEVHCQVQRHLFDRLPQGEAELERPFPQIGRIADLCWKTRSLIFEVQCSGITGEEVQRRNRDYQSIGYSVVWILHDTRFNRARRTGAEATLWDQSYYYTNIDASGRGIIYDQPSRRTLPMKVILEDPKPVPALTDRPWLSQLKARASIAPYCFTGDALDATTWEQPPLALLQGEAELPEYPKRASTQQKLINFLISLCT